MILIFFFRFVEQQPAVLATLLTKEVRKNYSDALPSDETLADMEMLVKILEPLKTVTTLLCAEGSPTVSMIIPLKSQLLHSLQILETDSPIIKALKKAIAADLEPR